jgi:hypothetical protein
MAFMSWKILVSLLALFGLSGGALFFLLKNPLPFLDRPAKNQALAEPARLRDHVDKLAVDFFPRSIFQPETLDRVADYLGNTWQSAGLPVEEFSYTVPETGERRYRVVYTRFPGVNASLAPLVIGAHYDAIALTPGADDNASAVAVLLELGRLLRQKAPKYPVELVAFPNEEMPSFGSENMGSYRYAQRMKEDGKKIRAMISLEMLGYYRSEPKTQTFPLGVLEKIYPTVGNFLCFASSMDQALLVRRAKRAFWQATDFPVETFVGPRFIKGLMNSDHSSFLALGFPAFMATDTAYYRNANYHTPEDLPESLDYQAMAKVTDGLYRMLFHWR